MSFQLEFSTIYAVQGLSLQVGAGERVGVVGESGSGKSITALSIMRMVPFPGKITEGEIIFAGQELVGLSRRDAPGPRTSDRHDPAKPADIAQPRADRRGRTSRRSCRSTSGSTRTSPVLARSSCSPRWGSPTRLRGCSSTRTA